MKACYLTTAIDYANGSPHLGHAYEKVLTDVMARVLRLRGQQVHFLTGLDEHGQKVQQSAARAGVTPRAFVDGLAPEFMGLCRRLSISNDDFIRTTEPRHQEVVQAVLQDLYDRGEIYQAEYVGFYSVRQEQFVLERERLADGSWPEIYGEVVELTEQNYFFRLTKYQDWLREYIRAHDDFIFPRFRQKQVLEFLKEPINDLCISRPVERLAWGIPLPFDPGYVTYVWFDALLNYISAIGYGTPRQDEYWPADFQVIGKDILVPAHAVYWPIMLKAMGVALPKTLLVHGWWLAAGDKMSKTKGNVVNPLELAEQFGAEAFRYFLIREMNVGQDSDFSAEVFLSRYQSDLANDLGNLVSRTLNMTARYAAGVIPAATVAEEPEATVRAAWERTHGELLELCDGMQFHLALDRVFGFLRELNRYAEGRAPWKLAKSAEAADRARLETALATLAEGLRLAAAALAPVMPETAAKIYRLLGLGDQAGVVHQGPVGLWQDELTWSTRLANNPASTQEILFPRPTA